MKTIKLQNKDTHTLCPVPGSAQGLTLPLPEGTEVRYNGKSFKVTKSTEYMSWFKGQKFEVAGASKSTPQEIEIEIALEE